jgi:hypothetical protein
MKDIYSCVFDSSKLLIFIYILYFLFQEWEVVIEDLKKKVNLFFL